MGEKPLTLKEVREAARRAAEEIENTWPQWKKDLSEPVVIKIRIGACSDRDKDSAKTMEDLRKENEALKKIVKDWQIFWGG